MIRHIRHGKCEPDKCGALCCKVMVKGDDVITLNKDNVCTKLKNNKCSLQKKNKPDACKGFPHHPHDLIYLKVKDKCSFYFETIEEGM